MSRSVSTTGKRGQGLAGAPETTLPRDEQQREFSLWMLAALKLEVSRQQEGVYTAEVPEPQREAFDGIEQLRFVCRRSRCAERPDLQLLAPGSPLFDRLLSQLSRSGDVIHSAPRGQPTNVHELTPRLLGAYRFQEGTVHLGGCTLEDRPVVRLTHWDRCAEGPPQMHHTFFWPDGRELPEEMIARLGLTRLDPIRERPPRAASADVEHWRQMVRNHGCPESESAPLPIVESIVWCKYAEGKVVFVDGERFAEVPFTGWARGLASGQLPPPPFRCAICGRQSYHLAVTDDGQITVADAIEACRVSGKRVIHTELETCAVTGQRALAEYLQTCPLTNQRVLATAMVPCAVCQQRVSPAAIKEQCCQACRRMQRVKKEDTRLARILGEYQGLDHWRRWRLSETTHVFILVGRAMWRQLLVVVDKSSLEVHRLATASPLSSRWLDVPSDQFDRYLHWPR